MSAKSVSLLFAFVLIALASLPVGAKELKYVDFLEQLIDLDSLPLIEEGVQCRQWSSYDRASKYDSEKDEYINWGANGDSGHYIRVDEETGEGVMAEIDGPGCIYRIWSANPTGKIRFYLDGDEEPTYEFNFNDLFTGKVEPFVRPFVWQRAVVMGGGNTASDCYLPIPFGRSCKVTADKPHGQYYHIGFKTFPAHWQVEKFHFPFTEAENKKLKEVAERWGNCGKDPQPDEKSKLKIVTRALTLAEEITIVDLKGPGTIKQLNVKLDSDDPYAARNIILRAYWDGSNEPAIWCPVGDFFGRACGDKPYASLPLGMTDDGDYSFWRMPFRKAAKITLTNEGKESGGMVTCSVRYSEGNVPDNAAYFHAKWRREHASETFDYPFLECTGKGKFTGVMHYVDNIVGGWWGEGDEKIYVDGEKFPSTFGTGSEDYYGDAWGIRWFVNPYHGCPQNEGRKQACYRWHISDSIPFNTQFKITIENYSVFRETVTDRNGYTSVAYWYAMPDGTDFFKPYKPAERIPSPAKIVKGAIEIEDIYDHKRIPDGVRILDDFARRNDFSSGRAVEYEGKADSTFPITFKVPHSENYTVELYTPDGMISTDYKVLYKGKHIDEKLWLGKGRQTLILRFPPEIKGKRKLVLDYVFLRPWQNYIRKWMVIGPFDNSDGKQLDTVYDPERTIDFKKEYKGKGGVRVEWHEVSAMPSGLIDLRNLMQRQKLPADNVLAYALVYVESPSEREVELLAGSDDGIKIWVNGRVVHTNDVYRFWAPDSDRVKIRLKKGRNEILVKVHQGSGGWGFSLRIVDPKEDLKYYIE